MTDAQKSKIEELRSEGMGYGSIAKALGISDNTVKSYCRRNSLTGIHQAPQRMHASGSGKGSDAGWGRLKSGAGWIRLSFADKI